MKLRYWFLIVFIGMFCLFFISVGMIGSSIGTTVMNDKFIIEITGTNGMAFSGAMSQVEFGSSTVNSFDGRIPATYSIEGMMASVSVQKQTAEGTLTVTIKDSSGKVIKRQSTSAAYGVIAIASL